MPFHNDNTNSNTNHIHYTHNTHISQHPSPERLEHEPHLLARGQEHDDLGLQMCFKERPQHVQFLVCGTYGDRLLQLEGGGGGAVGVHLGGRG